MIPACLGRAARLHCERASLALAVLVAGAGLNLSFAQEDVLRVCQDPNNLPFSNDAGQGFENKIAELLARELGWKLEYFSFPQRMGFIRNTLRFKLPGEQYRCDLVIGVPAGYDQVWTTRPYYHSTYVLIYPQGGKLEGVHTAKDLDAALARDQLAGLRIGIFDRSPASEWLVKHGLLEQAVPYRMLNADPDFYPGEVIEKDLAAAKLDAAIVWGPIAGFLSQRLEEPRLILVPLPSEPPVRLDYEIAMGVRYGEREWKATIQRLLVEHESDIERILREYGVPLLDTHGRLKP